jgi:hypothetical protein
MDNNTEDIVFELENISDYILDITQNKLIIKRNLIKINNDNINSFNYIKSNILECNFNNQNVSKLKYKSIILDLWKYLKSINVDFRNFTSMNYKEGEYKKLGHQYDKKLNVSLQGKDAKGSFLEIFNLVNNCNINFYIKIQLEDKKVIYFENNNLIPKNNLLPVIDLNEYPKKIMLNLQNINEYNYDNSDITKLIINNEDIKKSYQYLIYYLLEKCENTGYDIYNFDFIKLHKNGTDEYSKLEGRITYNNKYRIQSLTSKRKILVILNILELLYIDFELEIKLIDGNILYIEKENGLNKIANKYKLKNIHFFMNKDINKGQDLLKFGKDEILENIIGNIIKNNLNIAIKNGGGQWYIKNKDFNKAYETLNNPNICNVSRCKCYLLEY